MVTRSYSNAFEVQDLTAPLLLVPNEYGLINQLGLFQTQGITTHTLTFETDEQTIGLIPDQTRGVRNTVNSDGTRRVFAVPTVHHPLDDYVYPSDLVGKRAYGSDNQETEAAVLQRKLEKVRKSHAYTVEKARAQMLTLGTVYSPNGTVSVDVYSLLGVTRKSIDSVLGTATTEIQEKLEEGIAHSMDNIKNGGTVDEIVMLCSPEYFAKFIRHAKVNAAFNQYMSSQEPLRNRLGGMSRYRSFVYNNITMIEYRSDPANPLIPAGKAYMLPRGVDNFLTSFYSPANKMSLVGTLGEEAYAFSYRDPKDEGIVLQSEHNAVHMCSRPAAIVEFTSSN